MQNLGFFAKVAQNPLYCVEIPVFFEFPELFDEFFARSLLKAANFLENRGFLGDFLQNHAPGPLKSQEFVVNFRQFAKIQAKYGNTRVSLRVVVFQLLPKHSAVVFEEFLVETHVFFQGNRGVFAEMRRNRLEQRIKTHVVPRLVEKSRQLQEKRAKSRFFRSARLGIQPKREKTAAFRRTFHEISEEIGLYQHFRV